MSVILTETWTGADGSAWPAAWANGLLPTGGGRTIQTNAGRQTCGSAGGYAGSDRVSTRITTGNITNGVVLFRFQFPTGDECYPRFYFRSNESNADLLDAQSGYWIEFSKGTNQYSIGYGTGYGNVDLGSPILKSWATATWYWIRFGVVDHQIKARLWDDGTPEPDAWNIEINDSNLAVASGAWGFSVGGGGAASPKWDVDDFSANTGFPVAPDGIRILPSEHPALWTPFHSGPKPQAPAFDTATVVTPAVSGDVTQSATRVPTVSGSRADSDDATQTVSRSAGVGGARADSGSITQSATRQSTVAGARADSGTESQTATRVSTVGGARADSGSVSQSATRAPTVTGHRADAGTVTQTATRTATVTGTVTGSVTQTVTRTATTAGARADSGAVTQAVTRGATVAGARADSGSVAQTATRTPTVAGARADAGTVSQTVTRAPAVGGARADSGSVSQAVTRTASVVGSIGGTGQAVQAATRQSTVAGARSDSGSVTQSAARAPTVTGLRTDTGAESQTVTRVPAVTGRRADSGLMSQAVTRLSVVTGTVAAPGAGDVTQTVSRSAAVVGGVAVPPTNSPVQQAITRSAIVIGFARGGVGRSSGWYGLIGVLKQNESYVRENEFFESLDCPHCGTVMQDHHCPFDGYAERGAEAAVQKGGVGVWGQLLAMQEEARLMQEQDAATPLAFCPEDGQPLLLGPDGVLYCPFDGWRDEGRQHQ